MTIFFVNRFFHPDQSATSQIVSALAFSLAARGHQIEAVTNRHSYDGTRQSLPSHEKIEGVAVHRIWTTRFGRDGLRGRAIDYLTFHISAALYLWRHVRRGDIVVALTDPPLLSIPGALICRARGASCVNWIQDLFPEVARPLKSGGGLMRAAFEGLRRLRDHSLRAAAMNVVIGTRMAQNVAAAGAGAARIRLIPNWADGAVIAPIDPAANPLREQLSCGDALVIGYSGNLGRVHEIETILEAMRILAKPETAPPRELLWVFTGGGALVPRLRDEVKHRGYGNVRFEPYRPQNQLAQSLCAADVHLVSLRPAFEGLVVPSKFYGIAAAGRPVIFVGDPEGEIAGLIETWGCGTAVAAGDGSALAKTIKLFASDPGLAVKLGEAGRRAFELEFNRDVALARWERVLADIKPGQKGRSWTRPPTLRDLGRTITRSLPWLDRFARAVYRVMPARFHDTPTRRLAEFFEGEPIVSFVQIGAFDGIAGDPIRELVLTRQGWRGALVEPQKAAFEALRHNYAAEAGRLVFFNVAVAESAGQRMLYTVSSASGANTLPSWAAEVASFDRAHVEKHFPYTGIIAHTIETMTFADVAASLPSGIADAVVIDVEGSERQIIDNIDFDRHKVRFLVYEHVHLSPQDAGHIEARLRGAGFATKGFGRDTIAWRPAGSIQR